eukprot:14046599-Alexandrium_andersonii.AAC.1
MQPCTLQSPCRARPGRQPGALHGLHGAGSGTMQGLAAPFLWAAPESLFEGVYLRARVGVHVDGAPLQRWLGC